MIVRVQLLTLAAPAALVAVIVPSQTLAQSDNGWVIRSFDVEYVIDESGAVAVREDIVVDFRDLQRHGIFRDIPVEYHYDAQNNRLIPITDVRVTDGTNEQRFELIDSGPNLRVKIGDPDMRVSGVQRYVIDYKLEGALNPFPTHDEFFWNVTGNGWPVPIERASAIVVLPAGSVQRVACFQGPLDSTRPCDSTFDNRSARFHTIGELREGWGLTVVVGLRKGAVAVGEPLLVPKPSLARDVKHFMGISPAPTAAAVAVFLASIAIILRLWWIAGRDRWFGDMWHLEENPRAGIKPLLAREAIVTEYQPPEIERRGRRLRPAEVGTLIDERADTLDVSATIVDLAVRGYLRINELKDSGFLGLFKSRDYELEQLKGDNDLERYERSLLEALFEKPKVKLSDLKNKFYEDLAQVKKDLYIDVTKRLKFFPANPERVRTIYRVVGAAIAGAGGLAIWFLGSYFGAGVVGVSVVLAGALLFLVAPAMPRRTAAGRLMYRRCLGFRRYMETAEKDRQRFAEEKNIFHEYLPYAIVYGCVDKWAKAFEGLEMEPQTNGWYVGAQPLAVSRLADRVSDFSSSISGVMASTPGGSGSSGFAGGSSGGGGGGGGGGSW
jgi:uncharacterized membrane protein YgcG